MSMTKKELIEAIVLISPDLDPKELGEMTNADLTEMLEGMTPAIDEESEKVYKCGAVCITSLKGILVPDQEVTADCFAGGEETLKSLIKRGLVA